MGINGMDPNGMEWNRMVHELNYGIERMNRYCSNEIQLRNGIEMELEWNGIEERGIKGMELMISNN